MIQLNLAFFVFGILFCVTSSLIHISGRRESCIEEKRISGEVSSNKAEECIDIHVPPNQFLRLNILELKLYSSDCRAVKLEIIIKGSEDKYTFCRGDKIGDPITALTDVRVRTEHNSFFKLKFSISDIECLRNSSFHCSNHSCIPSERL
ncbi:uncharacterized protein [Parasteatoda tepidariorum]|uniref:uncharacterized protein n=1 Tax=Parasteatoda tepidariorum TaxID=114398 RepID=UPI0039BC2C0E